MKTHNNITPTFKGIGKLGVFAGLCAGLSAPQAMANTASTSQSSASQKNTASETLVIKGQLPSLYDTQQLSDPKFSRPISQITRTVTVVPEKVLHEQQVTNLTDALKNVPGAGAFFAGENGSSTTGDNIYMRGVDSSSSIYVDGVRDIASISRDTFNTHSVEVIKGPSGSDYGRSAPSGSINMVSKRPKLETSVDGSLSYGSASNRRATVDYNQMVNDNTAFRINLMGDKGNDKTRNQVSHEKYGFAPSIAFGLDTSTRVILDYLHLQQTSTPDGGIPTVGLPGYSAPKGYQALNGSGTVNRHNFYGTSSDFEKDRVDRVTLRFEHDLSENTTLRNITRWGETRQQYLLTAVMGGAGNIKTNGSSDVNDWSWARLANTHDSTNQILTNQTNISSHFTTGSVKHDLSSGVEFTRETQTTYGLNGYNDIPTVNIYHPDSQVALGGLTRSGADAKGTTKTLGVYAFDTLQLTDKLQFNGGVRLDSYHTDYRSATACGGSGRNAVSCGAGLATGTPVTTVDTSKSGNLVNWKAGALYQLTPQGNLYLNYGVSQQPPGGSNFQLANSGSGNSANRTDFQPQKAATTELGSKWSLMDDHLLLSAALFRTEIKNDVEQDSVTKEYSQVGRKRVQGYELSVSGDITEKWHALAGYTLQNSQVKEGNAQNNDGSSYLSYTPKHAFSAWTTYQFTPDILAGAGARYVGSMHRGKDGAVGTPDKVDNYWVADAMAGYRVNPNLDLQLNVYNLFDTHYVQSINKSGYRYHPGAERTWMLTANVHF